MFSKLVTAALATATAAHKMDNHELDMAVLHRKLAELECGNSAVWYKKRDPSKTCDWVAQWAPRCDAKGWDNSFARDSCPLACDTCPAPAPEVCPAIDATFDVKFGTNLYDAMSTISRASGATTMDETPTLELASIGSLTALIPEASDAMDNADYIVDGQSGDIDFPFGKIKTLATVGEVWKPTGEPLAGVPDGMGAYLLDDDTIRIIVQSESYGTVWAYESYPWFITNATDMMTLTGASYTGSHLQYGDIDRDAFVGWMDTDASAEHLFKGFGNMIEKAVNLKGELVMMRNKTGPTMVGAHYSNTDADGNYVLAIEPKYADWVMQSLCSAHMEEPYQWGEGIGSVDRVYMTNEEWMSYSPTATAAVGLSAHAVDVATKTAYAVGTFAQGGFEKTSEIMSPHADYVVWAISGYNGDFSSASLLSATIERRNMMYPRETPYVATENIHPARVYVGLKGFDEFGNPSDSFLARNGLAYGHLYGFACNTSATGFRDAWHKVNYNGAMVDGAFVAVPWTWNGTVVNFEHDAAWSFQDPLPEAAGLSTDMNWWNANGLSASGAKTEHLSPSYDGTTSYVQTSTAGYFGKYTLTGLAAALDTYAGTMDFPASIPAEYLLYQGETDVVDQIELGGKGVVANGGLASTHYETVSIEDDGSYTVTSAKTTFEDIDGMDTIMAMDGEYVIIQEDSGNDFGERTFISELKTGMNLTYYFIAQSGGSANTRMVHGVGVPAGANVGAGSHEFSGIIDLSPFIAKDGAGAYLLDAATYTGVDKIAAMKAVNINDKYIMLGLQSHNMIGGAVNLLSADRGGQWLVYQPSI